MGDHHIDAALNPDRHARHIMSNLLGSKEEEWTAAVRTGPLGLLDLPVDVLNEVVRHVSTISSALRRFDAAPVDNSI